MWRQSRTAAEVGGMGMTSLVVMKGKGWGRRGLFLAFGEDGLEMGEDGWSGA